MRWYTAIGMKKSKVAAQFVVVVLNYIISKLIVFREKE